MFIVEKFEENRNMKKQVSGGHCAGEFCSQCCLAKGPGRGWSMLGLKAKETFMSEDRGVVGE